MIIKKVLKATRSITDIAGRVTNQTTDLANRAVAMTPGVSSVSIPDNLSDVTQIGEEVATSDLGLADDCADRVWGAVEGLYRSRMHNQISLCVRREGEIIINRSIGVPQGQVGDAKAVPGSPDTPFCLFSGSKAVSALLLCKFEELGEISLDDPISKYIPDFSKHGKGEITLGDLISHRAKIPSLDLETPAQITDHDYILERLCDAYPRDAKQAYHAITGGFIIAEVIERVTGKPVQSALDTYFRKPLGMKYFTYGLQKRYRGKFAKAHVSGIPILGPMKRIPLKIFGMPIEAVVDFSNEDSFLDAVLPAGNMFANAEESSRFYQMLLDNGLYGDQQVLHHDTIRKARSGGFLPAWDDTFNIPAHFSRGGFMLNTPPVMLFGFSAPRAFGHLGFINTLTWADPGRMISVGLLTSGKPFLGPHIYNFVAIPNAINYHCPKL